MGDVWDSEVGRPALGSAAVDDGVVEAFVAVADKGPVGGPAIKRALGEPCLELARDALVIPRLMLETSRRHRRHRIADEAREREVCV